MNITHYPPYNNNFKDHTIADRVITVGRIDESLKKDSLFISLVGVLLRIDSSGEGYFVTLIAPLEIAGRACITKERQPKP